MGRNARLRKARKEAGRLANMGEVNILRLTRRLSHAQLAKKLGIRPSVRRGIERST